MEVVIPETNTHVIVQENGVLIPKELFGRNAQVLAELKANGVLAEPANGAQHPVGKDLPAVRRVPPLDLSRELTWLKEHQHEYLGQWVALAGDQLISHGANAREVAAAARAAGVAVPFITQIDPPAELPFGGW
jgi:hypothetical protein